MELEVVNVKYVGPATVKRLAEHGITSVQQLADMSVETLIALPGIGENTAPLIIASAQAMLAQSPQDDAIANIVLEDEVITPNTLSMDGAAIEVELVAAFERSLSTSILKKQAKQEKKAKKAAKQAQKDLKKATKKAAKKAEKAAKKDEKAVRKAKKHEKKAKKK